MSWPGRMLQLSVSWLGLETVAASPWLLLLLVGASWLMSRVLVWTYAAYNYSRHLQSFPQPPKRNWFLGHLGLVPPTEQGLRDLTQLVTNYPKGYMTWMGPITPLVILCHPDLIRTMANVSGTHAELVVMGAVAHLRASSPSLSGFYVDLQDPSPSSHSVIILFPSCIHQPHFTTPPSSRCCLYPIVVSLLKYIPDLEEINVNREVPDLMLLRIGQRKMGCGNPEKKQVSLLEYTGRLPGGGVPGTGSGKLSKNFKPESRVIQ